MAKTVRAVLLFVVLVFSGSYAVADFYQWVDENGVVNFSDTLPKSSQKVETITTPVSKPPTSDSDAVESEIDAAPEPEKRKPKKIYRQKKSKKNYSNNVEIFTTSW